MFWQGKCTCHDGWSGPTCERSLCAEMQCGLGTCEKGSCECPRGYSGDRCQFVDRCEVPTAVVSSRIEPLCFLMFSFCAVCRARRSINIVMLTHCLFACVRSGAPHCSRVRMALATARLVTRCCPASVCDRQPRPQSRPIKPCLRPTGKPQRPHKQCLPLRRQPRVNQSLQLRKRFL